MLEVKNTVLEMKKTFDGLINTLYAAEERISENENMTIETSQSEKQREKRLKETEQKQKNSMLSNLVPRLNGPIS